MKNICIAFLLLGLLLPSCNDTIDIKPLDLISDANVWTDKALSDAYLSQIYSGVRFTNLEGQSGFNIMLDAAVGGELRPIGAWQAPYRAAFHIADENGEDQAMTYYNYVNIRGVNEYIKKMVEVSTFEEDFIQQRVAEARFLRAYMYFQMVKRYGGVPLITTPQPLDAPEEELFPKRNSEKEVYDFINTEMDEIAEILPDQAYDESNVGRPTRWAALALKSRASLYLASVGQFGEVQLDGLLGISVTEAQDYWQKSYDASKKIMTESFHGLYEVETDPVANFSNIFMDESYGNTEVIFAEKFDFGLNHAHAFSSLTMPDGFARAWGSNYNPMYDLVELFEFADGSSGKIPRNELVSQEWSVNELFLNRDPRFIASIFFPESPWQGSKVYFHSNTIGTVSDPEWPKAGPKRNIIRTGFHLRKRLNESIKEPLAWQDGTDYLVFRMGEIYLNYAEAAYYLGKEEEALATLNRLRQRAGMPAKDNITPEIIRNERQVELAFEDHRYWDLRRWRIAVEVLDNKRLQGLKYVYNADTEKYQITLNNAEGAVRVFQERHYYFPMGIKRLAENSNLVENPGYEVTEE